MLRRDGAWLMMTVNDGNGGVWAWGIHRPWDTGCVVEEFGL